MDDEPRLDYAIMPRVPARGGPSPGVTFRLLGDERELLHESERWRSRQFVLLPAPALIDSQLRGRGELASLDPAYIGPESIAGDGAYRLLSLALEGEWNGFGYGAGYRSVGKKLEKLARLPPAMRDQKGGEVWLERRIGIGRVRLFLSDFSDNVDRDPARPRTTKTQGGVTTAVTLPAWPTVSLSYLHGASESEAGRRADAGAQSSERWLDTLIASLSYRAAVWTIGVSSTYSASVEKGRPRRETIALAQEVSGSYRPTEAITITSSLSRREEYYDGVDVQNRTTWASLSLAWNRLFQVFQLTASGTYLHTTSTDGYVDGTTTTATASVARHLGKWLWGNGAVSVELGYSGYRDAIYPEASYRDVFGLLRLRVISF
jgi:hypothetical protein